MKGSAAERLRRLRWMLTAIFTTLNAIGLIVLAVAFLRTYADQQHKLLEADLLKVTSTVSRLVYYENNTVITAAIGEDDISRQCPQFAVLPSGSTSFSGYFSKRTCVTMDPKVLAGLAYDSTQAGTTLTGFRRAADGRPVWVVAYPVRNGAGEYIAAVVAVADGEPTESAYDLLVVAVVGGCLLIIVLLAVSGYFLSGRAIRPAAVALEQQEILLAETAHDLRTPVASLRALAETALRHPDQGAALLPRTVALAGRMGEIIDSLLMRARLAAGLDKLAFEPVWLDQLVSVVVEESAEAGSNVTVAAAPTRVIVDPALVRRAVGNLLENALHYGRAQPDQAAIVHITVASGRVTVADHGPGVSEEIAESVLDRFQTGSGSTGLGLSIVRWVAEVHGGVLNVYNADEGGAIFELDLGKATSTQLS
ncbi:sensor histidine kinase [Fodinicola acaciae]|uniref:sensor histidine kinase n=1 Tax=Fodinicola acaciae TaxID=2681555 RepID=UPI001C9E2600|nr:HAMP domain-containing sensor histidine kinase [Fodinicola acaciae]